MKLTYKSDPKTMKQKWTLEIPHEEFRETETKTILERVAARNALESGRVSDILLSLSYTASNIERNLSE
jgi:hypothetical protein